MAEDTLNCRPLVSIITPSYNQGHFIEYAIGSIRSQSYDNIEHIVVDGGSTDQTLSIIRRYEGTYNMRWLSEPDAGMYDAINKGMRLARGDILAYLNCDDMYFPWSVEMAVDALQETPLIFGDLVNWHSELGFVVPGFAPPFFRSYYRSIGIIPQAATFLRRSVIERVGLFDQHFRIIADVEFWLRCDAMGIRPKKVYEFLAVARVYGSVLSQRKKSELQGELAEIRRRYSGSMARFKAPYYIVMFLYWRFAFLTFAFGRSAKWQRLRHSGLVHMDCGRVLWELAPTFIRKPQKRTMYLDIHALCQQFVPEGAEDHTPH